MSNLIFRGRASYRVRVIVELGLELGVLGDFRAELKLCLLQILDRHFVDSREHLAL